MEEGDARKFVDRYLCEIMKIKTVMGQMRLPALAQVMVAVHSLPYRNVDCERAFSVVPKVHTGCHQSLNADMLTALLQCKFDNDRLCYEFNL